MDKTEKAEALKAKAPKKWDSGLGSIEVDKIEIVDGNLWVTLKDTGFPVDPDGYYFVNPPIKHGETGDESAAFKVIVEDAARHYAEHPSGQTTTTIWGTVAQDRAHPVRPRHDLFERADRLHSVGQLILGSRLAGPATERR